MKPHYTFSICLLATSVLTGCVKLPRNLQSNPTPPMDNVSLSSNGQPARPDTFAMPLEVIRYDRYLLVETSSCHKFQQPPATKITTKMALPLSIGSLVGH